MSVQELIEKHRKAHRFEASVKELTKEEYAQALMDEVKWQRENRNRN